MNFVSTGIREVTRRLRRSKNRLALANARKFVDKAETALGRHGWRDLAEDETVHPVYQTLLDLDREVAAAHAHIAELDARVHEQEAEREAAARTHREALDAVEAERGPARQALLDLQNRRVDHQKALQALTARTAALRSEQAALLKQERRAKRQNLLADEAARAGRQQALDDQRAALAEQAAQLAVARAQAVEPLVNDQDGIKETRARLSALDNRAQDAHAELAARERAVDVAIAGLHKEIAATRRQAARVEEQKDDSFLVMGRRLTERAATPIGGDDLFTASRRHRQSYEKLAALETAWMHESENANKQDLRIFNFVGVTAAVLLALGLLLAFHAPARRDWLPRETQTILTVDVSRFTDADFTRALQMQEPDTWQAVWSGLLRKVAEVPLIDVRRRVLRITRAFAPSAVPGGPPVDYLLVAMRESADVENIIMQLPTRTPQGGFGRRMVSNLPIYEKGGRAGHRADRPGHPRARLDGGGGGIDPGTPGAAGVGGPEKRRAVFQRVPAVGQRERVPAGDVPAAGVDDGDGPSGAQRAAAGRLPDAGHDAGHARAGVGGDFAQRDELPEGGPDGAHARNGARPGVAVGGRGAEFVHRAAGGEVERKAGGMAVPHDGAGGAGVFGKGVAPGDARHRAERDRG